MYTSSSLSCPYLISNADPFEMAKTRGVSVLEASC